MDPPTTMWTRLGRRLGTDHNPLRRRSDLIEAWLLPAAVAVFLILGPLLVGASTWWVHHQAAAVQQAQRSWHEVPAVVVQPVPGPLVPGNSDSWMTWTAARWTDAGQQHTGLIPARSGTWAGRTVPVWLDRAGHVQMPPLTPAQIHYRVMGTAEGALALLAVALACLALLYLRILRRRALADWENAWISEGPQWSHQS
ncbi:MAG: hypothetical protein ABJB47_17490 [Actinomycetota bacterium]